MKVSLIVITYNWPQALSRILDSIGVQTRLPDEVIITDDGSTADTSALVADAARFFPVPLRYLWQEDRGFRAARARNRGIAATTGDYIVLLDGDMLIHPHFIADHLMLAEPGYFLQGGRLKASYTYSQRLLAGADAHYSPWIDGNFYEFDGTRRLYAFRQPALARWKAHSRSGGRVMSCNMSFWKTDLMRVNGFDERMQGYGSEDRELVVRLENLGLRRRALKWCALAMHLEHNPRAQAERNDPALPNNQLLQESIARKSTRCEQGVDQHLAEFSLERG